MNPRSEATLEELFSLLPDLDELEALRLAVVGAAVPDPVRAWDSSSAYATIDKRIVTPERVERALDEAEEALHRGIQSLYGALRPVFRAFWAGDGAEAARRAIALGEKQEGEGRVAPARRCYAVALTLSLPLAEKGPQVLALRRIARASLTLGDLQEAHSYYQRSAELARDAGDPAGHVIALTGVGNVRSWQGRWAEAETGYAEALALLDARGGSETLQLERAQLYNNLASVTTRQNRLEEAEGWFAKALALWDGPVRSPLDLAVCYHNLAYLRDVQGRREEARRLYQAALELPIPLGLRSGIAIDLAENFLVDGHVTQAEQWGRQAEEHAIAARSPYHLSRMYQGRGNVARARGGEDGITFYEKALEIAREKGYPFLEAETLVEYALMRQQAGGAEEAQAYLERAREIFAELGTVRELARVEQALRDAGGRSGSRASAAP